MNSLMATEGSEHHTASALVPAGICKRELGAEGKQAFNCRAGLRWSSAPPQSCRPQRQHLLLLEALQNLQVERELASSVVRHHGGAPELSTALQPTIASFNTSSMPRTGGAGTRRHSLRCKDMMEVGLNGRTWTGDGGDTLKGCVALG